MRPRSVATTFALSAVVLATLPALSLAALEQSAFRVRSDFTAALTADAGWAAPLNQPATIFADQPFRLRFEIATDAASSTPLSFRLQYQRNDDAWTDLEAHDFPHPESENAKTPRASLVACAAYPSGAATTDLLPSSRAPFAPGAALGLAAATPPWRPADAPTHSEFEWALVVRRFADHAVTNESGDTFAFRLLTSDGTALPARHLPALRLAIAPRHVGGTFVETPGRIGPWQARNGDLYFIMEPAETSNLFMMIKSTDHGQTWREVDAANRPPTRDLESVDGRQIGDTLHLIHQVTRSARYHSFRTSDHPTHPDTWFARADEIGAVRSVAQAANLVVRSDASRVAVYVGETRLHLSVRPPDGPWREAAVIDSAVGPQAILGANDAVHLAYYKPDGTLWHRRFLRDGTLTDATQLASGLGTTRAEFGSVLPLVHLPKSNTTVVLYRDATGHLFERRLVADRAPTPARRVTDRPVIQNAVDSQQPGADVIADGETLHVLFIDAASRAIYSTTDAGGWQPATLRVDRILGSWVRGNLLRRADGTKVYGFIYDAGSDGGAGMNRYADYLLPPPSRTDRP